MSKNAPIMKIQGVSLTTSVGSTYLVQDISFNITTGDRLAIIGSSGAGKTSLLRLLNRLSNPTSGSITLENRPVAEIPVISLRRQVVLVPQEPKLLGMKVSEALAYPLVLQNLSPREIRERVGTWSDRLKLAEDWLDRNELELSGGQKQLVAIARALVMEPKVLLLDEPTSALDLGRAVHLITLLTELANRGDTAIIMVNHQLELAQQFANRVLYLQLGRLLEDSSIEKVNWTKLRDNLIQAEAQTAQEWL
ncbi:MAG: ATP-binding cassette domain-containing protein [Prochloron sp. SP5CPC1]|nr:ATP-binding cassette domain-containing protein [Candidatus Paraprochloron terpiosi SP5CPC1]